jgi:hypothetical protein
MGEDPGRHHDVLDAVLVCLFAQTAVEMLGVCGYGIVALSSVNDEEGPVGEGEEDAHAVFKALVAGLGTVGRIIGYREDIASCGKLLFG